VVGDILHAILPYTRTIQRPQDPDMAAVYLSPYFWLLIGTILVMERLLPADRKQKVFSVGFAQDATYFVLITLFRVSILSLYFVVLKHFYDTYLNFLTIQGVSRWPAPARAISAILLSDFLAWFHHLLRHKVPLFWQFHMIHHSQKELNLFTDVRYHPFEYFINQTVQFIPLLMFQNAFPVAVGYAFFHQWYTKFYHGNVRTDLGILKHLLVTPQTHRIHHSIEARHRDKNFGVIFSIWDHLFGTQWKRYDEYPQTGIIDERFPHEKTAKGVSVLFTSLAQFVYPFRVIAGRRR
jgi:sterol desaturase/sphingolipid hydroxylase (fatty acid hydroxylase superfamily)